MQIDSSCDVEQNTVWLLKVFRLFLWIMTCVLIIISTVRYAPLLYMYCTSSLIFVHTSNFAPVRSWSLSKTSLLLPQVEGRQNTVRPDVDNGYSTKATSHEGKWFPAFKNCRRKVFPFGVSKPREFKVVVSLLIFIINYPPLYCTKDTAKKSVNLLFSIRVFSKGGLFRT